MKTRKAKTRKAAMMPKKPAIWSAEAFGEGGYEVVPPEKEEAFRKVAEEENRRRRPGMYAATQYYGKSVKGGRSAVRLAGKMVGAHFSEDDKMSERNCNLKRTRRFFETDEIIFTQEECTRL